MHTPVHAQEVEREMRSLGLKEDATALISESDPIVKALGLLRGDFVRIRRPGYHGNSVVFYRRVVVTKLKLKRSQQDKNSSKK